MTECTDPYQQGPRRPLIQHPWGDTWIAWNWNTRHWDDIKQPIGIDGERVQEEK